MEESAGKQTPARSKTRATNSIKGPRHPAAPEMDPGHEAESPVKKKTKPTASTDMFEAVTAGASEEISALLSKFAQVLNDRASADTSQMKELEGILAEARKLESYLKEKKQHLRQTLAVISDKLLG